MYMRTSFSIRQEASTAIGKRKVVSSTIQMLMPSTPT